MASKIFEPDSGINRFSDLIIGVVFTGLLMVLCSIPVITIGPAITAGYYTMAKVVRHHEGYVAKEFFKSFARNFKTAMALGIGYILAAVIVVFDYMYLKDLTDSLSNALVMVLFTVALIMCMTFFFVFFSLSRFDKSAFGIFKFGVIAAMRHFLSSIAIAVMFVASVLAVYLMPWGFCLFPGFALWGSTFLMERILRKYMPVPEEGSEEADKWYYKDIGVL